MFFKQILGAVLFFSITTCVYAQPLDVITFQATAGQIVTPCNNCPIPGKECDSYIDTSSDKICFKSYPVEGNVSENTELSSIAHEDANMKDVSDLRNDLNYPAHVIIDPVFNVDDTVILEEVPIEN